MMIRKAGFVIAFAVGAWFGYNYAIELLDFSQSNAKDPWEYWSTTGGQALRYILTGGCGLIAATVVYFLLNLFARSD